MIENTKSCKIMNKILIIILLYFRCKIDIKIMEVSVFIQNNNKERKAIYKNRIVGSCVSSGSMIVEDDTTKNIKDEYK